MTMRVLSRLLRIVGPVRVGRCRYAPQISTLDRREGSEAQRSFGMLTAIACALLVASHSVKAQHASGPTATNALAADDALSKSIRENDADGIERWLDKDWAVVSTTGRVGE